MNGKMMAVAGLVAVLAGIGVAMADSNEGLMGGSIGSAWDTFTPNPDNFGVVAGPQGVLRDTAAADAHWRAPHGVGAGSGPDNTTLVYTGQIHLPAGSTSFIGSIDDSEKLLIGGQILIDDGNWNSVDQGTFNAPQAGWYDFELRLGNGTGAYGYMAADGFANVDFGFGMKSGAATGNPTDYVYPTEIMDGTATLFRVPEPASMAVLAFGGVAMLLRRWSARRRCLPLEQD